MRRNQRGLRNVSNIVATREANARATIYSQKLVDVEINGKASKCNHEKLVHD